MPDIGFLLKVSRPRFWMYIFGPYIVGLIAASGSIDAMFERHYFVFAIYFTLPANLLVYGVNDIFDYDTDRLNPKKTAYEALVTPERRTILVLAIIALNLPFVAQLIYVPFAAISMLVVFVLLSIFYSAPPIRAKAKPFLDSAFNVLYMIPGVFAYTMASGHLPPWQAFVAGALWTAAMHAFSAIPDIDADREAKLPTIATTLGPTGTHLFCLAAYLASAVLSVQFLGWFGIAFGSVYAAMMIVSSLTSGREGVFQVYRYFPVINTFVGFCLFWYVAYVRFFA